MISVSRVAVPLRTPSRSTSPVAATPNGARPTTSMPVASATDLVLELIEPSLPSSTCTNTPARPGSRSRLAEVGARVCRVLAKSRAMTIETDPLTTHRRLLEWVEEVAQLTEPDAVHWRDGSAEEYDALCQALVDAGTFERLSDAKRSEEHTSELQSRQYLVCRLLLEKKN